MAALNPRYDNLPPGTKHGWLVLGFAGRGTWRLVSTNREFVRVLKYTDAQRNIQDANADYTLLLISMYMPIPRLPSIGTR